MKIISFLLSIVTIVSSIEIDIDRLSDDRFKIYIGNTQYDCTKKPPLSHSWAYECGRNNLRKLPSTDCDKCYKECGGEYPTLFPDIFCSNCIDVCY